MRKSFKAKSVFFLWSMVGLLFLHASLALPRLAEESLWGDEGWSIDFTNGANPRSVAEKLATDRHPPLYFVSLWAWRELAGDDLRMIRILSVWGTCLTAACLYQWGKTAFQPAVGLAAVFFLVLLDKQGDFSREARHYTWLMGWGVASSWLLIRWLAPNDSSWSSFAYVFAVIGGLYTHSFMFVFLLVQGVYALFYLGFSRRLGQLVGLWGLAGLAFAPWGLVFWHQYLVQGALRHDFPLTWAVAELLINDFLGAPVALFAGLLFLGAISPWLKQGVTPRFQAVLFPLLGFLLPTGLIVGLPSLSPTLKFLTDRNLSIIIPSLALLIGLGMMQFRGFARGALITFLLIQGLFTTDADQHNPPWRPLSRLIAQYQIPEQPVISQVGGEAAALDYHLRQEVGENIHHTSLWFLTENPQIEPMTALRFEGIGAASGFWYVDWSSDPTFLEAIQGWGYTRTASYQDAHLGSPIYAYRYDSLTLLDQTLTTFAETIHLHQAYYPEKVTLGSEMLVALWWSTPTPLTENYTVSVFLLNTSGQLVAQHDGLPQTGQALTLHWEPNQLVFDPHRLTISPNLPTDEVQMGVKLYNGDRILLTPTGEEFYKLGWIRLEG